MLDIKNPFIALAICLVLSAVAQAWDSSGEGTEANPYSIPTTASSIAIDGALDEEAWEGALVLELPWEVHPGNNLPAMVRTELLLMRDERNLYAGFRCFDEDAGSIKARYCRRDEVWEDDYVRLWLDTHNTGRSAYVFEVNPFGVQGDGTFATFADDVDRSWDGIWESGGRLQPWGYSIEIAIPFSQLNFQRTEGRRTWAIDAARCYPRDTLRFMNLIPNDRDNDCWICQFPKFTGLEGAEPGRNIEISPTVVAVRSESRDPVPGGELEVRERSTEAGVSARWGVASGITLQGTYNPDFSQVEADALQLEINEPFELFYPEKRPFFTEGAHRFETRIQAVHTRAIRDPEWGLKIAGRQGGNSIGAFLVRDEFTNLIFPGSHSSSATLLPQANTSGVFRYSRDFGTRLTLGALATDREGGSYYNRLAGVDGYLRISDADRTRFQLIGSRTSYPDGVSEEYDQPRGEFGDRALYLNYTHRGRIISYGISYMDIGPDFRADLGFVPMVDYRRLHTAASYKWYPRPDGWHNGMTATVGFLQYYDHDGELILREGRTSFNYRGPSSIDATLTLSAERESWNGAFFDQVELDFEFGFRPAKDLKIGVDGNLGDRIDYANTRPGSRIRVAPYLVYHAGRHLRLAFEHTFERLKVEGGRLYDANISQLTVGYHFDARMLLRAIVQHVDYSRNPKLYTSDVDSRYRNLLAQLLFSYQLNPRTVLFLGYTDDFYGGEDYSLVRGGRTLFVKLGYAWQL